MAIKSWRDVLPVHPAADLFPMMSKDELRSLGEDIKKNGLRTRVALANRNKQELLLDGRNRLDAMELVGIEVVKGGEIDKSLTTPKRNWAKDGFTYTDFTEDEAVAFIISANILRRHLTAEQRRELIAKVLKATPAKSNALVAEQIKSSDKTVASVRRDLESTSEIPRLTKTVGKDGKERRPPVKKETRKVLSKRTIAKNEARRRDEVKRLAEEEERHRVAALSIIDVLGEEHVRVLLDILTPVDTWQILDHLRREFDGDAKAAADALEEKPKTALAKHVASAVGTMMHGTSEYERQIQAEYEAETKRLNNVSAEIGAVVASALNTRKRRVPPSSESGRGHD